ncbi:hypothetical protein [Algisphaera agarilytica]|uniref:Uncharacterized protein YukE n=1 Tax=Algisphaera agarilytica TaxID=1385975 RepID=A0A7X0H300_9BACT|nr:hypothetical protein [Algisphaera agarilytica]MBB6428337.1 uncharacterized protein YukE [Algisphaera agarilytica]
MSLGVGASTLNDARKALNARWDELCRSWDDAAARKFEQEFIRPMDQDLKQAIDAMIQAQQSVQRARQECT